MTEYIMINNRKAAFIQGQTVLDVAKENQIPIPTLCYLKDVAPIGRCGICAVEIEGEEDLILSCSTIAKNGMNIKTDSVKVIKERKAILTKFLSTGNHNCAISGSGDVSWSNFQLKVNKEDGTDELCPVWGDCRLQDLAYQYQVDIDPDNQAGLPSDPMELKNPLIVRDFSRCILCGRCVAACNEVQVNRAITLDENLGKVVTEGDRALIDSNCVFCGECIQACPVGALVEKKSRYIWRPWKTEKIRTTCPYCGVGCQQMLHVQDGKIVKITGVENAEPNRGRLCVKGRFGYDFIYSKERLTTPLIKEDGEFREATWDEALDLVAGKFTEIIEKHGPDALAGVSCARSINEDSYQMQKLFRAVFKTNNIDHCART